MENLFLVSQPLADNPSTRHQDESAPIDAIAALLAELLSSGWTRSDVVLFMNEAADIAHEEDDRLSEGDCRSEVFDDFLEVLKGWLSAPKWPALNAKGDTAAWESAKDGEIRYQERKKKVED